jgi:hypothetical protein
VPIFVLLDSPRVPLGMGEAQVREGAAAQGHNPPPGHAWAPAQPPDEDGEPPAIAPANCGLEWLVLDEGSIASWTGAAWGGRWSRLSSGVVGDAAARRGWVGATGAFQSVLVSARVTSKLEGMARRVPGRGRRGWGVGVGGGSIDFISVGVK